jgi:hypothetical protein
MSRGLEEIRPLAASTASEDFNGLACPPVGSTLMAVAVGVIEMCGAQRDGLEKIYLLFLEGEGKYGNLKITVGKGGEFLFYHKTRTH